MATIPEHAKHAPPDRPLLGREVLLRLLPSRRIVLGRQPLRGRDRLAGRHDELVRRAKTRVHLKGHEQPCTDVTTAVSLLQ